MGKRGYPRSWIKSFLVQLDSLVEIISRQEVEGKGVCVVGASCSNDSRVGDEWS